MARVDMCPSKMFEEVVGVLRKYGNDIPDDIVELKLVFGVDRPSTFQTLRYLQTNEKINESRNPASQTDD